MFFNRCPGCQPVLRSGSCRFLTQTPGRKPIRQLGPLVRLRLVNHRCHRARLPLAGRTPSSKRRLDARGVVG